MPRLFKQAHAMVLLVAVIVLNEWCVLSAAETGVPAAAFTDYMPPISTTVDAAGFRHPGVGLTKDLLENVRNKLHSGAEPWSYYYRNMVLTSPYARKDVGISNSRDGITPLADHLDSQGIQSRFINDAVTAYTQALLYVITGEEVYRANALKVIRVWSKMDPAKYKPYTDCHIHAGIPLNRMVMAAEILRHTGCKDKKLEWTEQDTRAFTDNLVVPVTDILLYSQNHFMNQHLYPLIGAMSGYIFTGNRARYNEAVEWFTVNSTAKDQGFNGAIKALFRRVIEAQKPGMIIGEGTPVTPRVQHMEMGRDQAHGSGDLTNAAIIIRMLHAQNTRLDPVSGTVSIADNAIDPVEFLDDRLLGAANYFWQYMLGYDTEWTPQAYAITGGDPHNVGKGGIVRDTYNDISPSYRGRFGTANFWDFYSYYTYIKGKDVSKLAPYFYEAFTMLLPPSYQGWRNVDGGGDFWLYLPERAETDAAKFMAKIRPDEQIYDIEDRYTNITKLDYTKPAIRKNSNPNNLTEENNIDDSAVVKMREGDVSFVRLNVKPQGSTIVFLSSGLHESATRRMRIRTNGLSIMRIMGQELSLPDTGGEWRYVPITGSIGDFCEIAISGEPGVTVDLDHVNAAEAKTPVFDGNANQKQITTYVNAPVNIAFPASIPGDFVTLRYEIQKGPIDAIIDPSSGMFVWNAQKPGEYSLVVSVTDGSTVTSARMKLIVCADRAEAVRSIIASYDEKEVYELASLAAFQSAYNDTMDVLTTASVQEFENQLQALQTAVDGLRVMTPLTNMGSMRWSKVAHWSSWGKHADGLDDGRGGGGWYGLALGVPPHLYHLIDFGPDYKITANKFGFKASIFADRIANSTVYASNDRINWTRITPGVAAYTQEYNTIDVAPEYRDKTFRYIKLEMVEPLPDVLYAMVRNLLEPRGFTIYGTRYDIGNKIREVTLSAANADNGKAALGGELTLSITATEPINNLQVIIQGLKAVVTTEDNIHWLASISTDKDTPPGEVRLRIDYKKNDGTDGDTSYETTDGSKLLLADTSRLINVAALAVINASDAQWPGNRLPADKVGKLLFDGDPSTFGDLVNPNGYYTLDFGEKAAVRIEEVLLLPREAVPARLSGLIVQGSNDAEHWVDITRPAVSASANNWLRIADNQILSKDYFRYLRLFNMNNWAGNVAEVELYGEHRKH